MEVRACVGDNVFCALNTRERRAASGRQAGQGGRERTYMAASCLKAPTWSEDCSLLVRLLPDRSRPPEPV